MKTTKSKTNKDGLDIEQCRKHKLGRKGEKIAAKIVGGKKTTHKAPFDIVDFAQGFAYEVKTMSAWSKDLKVSMASKSYESKLAFAAEYGVEPILIVVVVHSPKEVEVYSAPLRQRIRVNQMEKIS